MSDYRIALRKTQALEVFQLIKGGLTVVAACDKVGISKATFYNYIGDTVESIEMIDDLRKDIERRQMLDIVSARADVLTELIDKVQTKRQVMSSKELTAIDNHLRSVQEELAMRNQDTVTSTDAELVQKLLQGPKTVTPDSRFSAKVTQTTTIEINSDKSESPDDDDVIDAEFSEAED